MLFPMTPTLARSCLLRRTFGTGSIFMVLCFATIGCSKKDEAPPAPAPAPSATAEQKSPPPVPLVKGHQYPIGPRLVFVPGKGVGAIRFGATVETIERHMEAPCDQKTPERCLYVRQAVEFFLKDGVLVRLESHRRDRKVDGAPPDKDQYFGSVRGILPPKIMMGLHEHVVIEEYGEPDKKESIEPPGPDGLVARHYYDGVILEYDKIENGNTVLASIEIVPSETALPHGKVHAKAQETAPTSPAPEQRAK